MVLPFPCLIRLRAPQDHAQCSVLEFQILEVQADDLRAAEAAGESEQDDRLVPERADIHAEGFAQGDDVLRAQRGSARLARAEFTPDAVEGLDERGIVAVEGESHGAMSCGDCREMTLCGARPQLFSLRPATVVICVR